MSQTPLKQELKKYRRNYAANSCLHQSGPSKKDKKNLTKLLKISKRNSEIFIIEEDEKRYIPYCTFRCHPGAIGEYIFKTKNCEKIHCSYYRKFIEEK